MAEQIFPVKGSPQDQYPKLGRSTSPSPPIPSKVQPPVRLSFWSGIVLVAIVALVAASLYNYFTLGEDETALTRDKRSFVAKYHNTKELARIEKLAAEQLPHFKDAVYLDYTGSGVYQKQQIEAAFANFSETLYGNSHSISPSSQITDSAIHEIRDLVLRWFNVDSREYTVIFTSGATGALKILGETFPWTRGSEYIYLRQNHNSVLGIREYALDRDATYSSLEAKDIEALLHSAPPSSTSASASPSSQGPHHLFAFPGQCNYSGVKYPLEWIDLVHNGSLARRPGRYWVLLDAAAYLPSAPLDLRKHPADFVCMSFYKMFGFPGGLGALVVRNEAAQILQKTFFSGGTVVTAEADAHFHQWHVDLHARFEDGSLPWLNIAALRYGFAALREAGGMDVIRRHVFSLMDWAYDRLSSMRHRNGQPLCIFYGNHALHDPDRQGGILNFNLLRMNGSYFGYSEVSKLASNNGFHIRTGCSCNPGACYGYLGIDMATVRASLAMNKNSCHDSVDMINGHPIGSVRVSFGYLSTFEHAHSFVSFIKTFFLNRNELEPETFQDTTEEGNPWGIRPHRAPQLPRPVTIPIPASTCGTAASTQCAPSPPPKRDEHSRADFFSY
ncbi:Molybdenum cofactor sulfurase [Paratrimastix pyriformis]|uniref:Molybdenum cofactor sulfurase n=1 Tax=Paratrimastix pyriformis TaxID=342808 RepID=A0ABQ8US68_9EUKA|nr:Molybdenum cofactor sulfurase [Paratrimastix pyriformis]